MRKSSIAKLWEELSKARGQRTGIAGINWSNVPGFVDGSFTVQRSITAICGFNGAGKTLLLQGIAASLNPNMPKDVLPQRSRLADATLSVSIMHRGSEVKCALGVHNSDFARWSTEANFVYLDVCKEALGLLDTFSKVGVVDEVINGIDPQLLTEKELRWIKYIVGKDYEKVEIYEIDDLRIGAELEYDGDSGQDESPRLRPYFRVQEAGLTYDIRTMSTGELSAFLTFWTFRRLVRDSIVLMEEPETFLSPNAQASLMDFIADQIVEKRLSVLLTTHSASVLEKLPAESVCVLFRMGLRACVASEGMQGDLLRAIGLRRQKSHIALVEDRAAREFTKLILQAAGAAFADAVEVIDVGGVDNIKAILSKIPRRKNALRFIGLVDRDVASTADGSKSNWPLGALPIDRNVEHGLRNFVDANISSVSEALGLPAERISMVHGILRGSDDHDWLEDFGSKLGFGYEVVLSRLVESWLASQQGAAELKNFIGEFEQMILKSKED